MSIENSKMSYILVWNVIIMVASKASLFVACAFLGSAALILLSKQLDNAFVEQRYYAPKIARLKALPDKVWQIGKGAYFLQTIRIKI